MRKNKTVVFLSNYFSHHQVALSDALWEITGGQYTFVETSERIYDRTKLSKATPVKSYVMVLFGNEERVYKLIKEADVVISGSAPEYLVQQRIKTGKLLFRYSERPLKKGLELWRYPDRFLRWHRKNPSRKPIYMLCASAYTASDYRKFGLFRNKCYKWGYFPETKTYADPNQLVSAKDKKEILWCGRFLDWKHPDDAIVAARKLKSEGYVFCLNFIGSGILENQLRQMVREFQLEDCVNFLGQMSPAQVREKMEQAGLYLFTSDREEGWGAVLNESMNSGCAVIASHAIGSVPYLIKDGENGLVYESGDVEQLCEKVRYLLENPKEQRRLGLVAYETIIKEWNAEVAAERLMELVNMILSDERSCQLLENGPCSCC